MTAYAPRNWGLEEYGTVEYVPSRGAGRPGSWSVRAEPHVMVRLKRILPRVDATRTEGLVVSDTAEVAHDLVWVLTRWPMRLDASAADRLSGRAAEHRATQDTVVAILNGERAPSPRPRTAAKAVRDYQQTAADLAAATGRLLLTDPIGAGKTFSALLLLLDPEALPAVVVVPTHLPERWCTEMGESFPWLRWHVATKGTAYDPATIRGSGGRRPDVLVLSYSKLAGWADYLTDAGVRTVIFDEAQELRREGSQKHTAAARVADAARTRFMASASPIYNYGGEIRNVIDVLAPGALGTREEFHREWCVGNGHKMMVREPAVLGAYLRDQGLLLGRTRADLKLELPAVTVVPQEVPSDGEVFDRLSGDAIDMARLILSASAAPKDRWHAAGELDLRVRQATGIAKAPYVAEFVRLLLESEERLLLFGWHHAVFDIWRERLADFAPAFYTGLESPSQKERAKAEFMGGGARVLVMSLRSAQGTDGLQKHSSVAVFGELDWSPQVHDQAIGRLDRSGKVPSPVVAYFMVSDQGSDPPMGQVLQLKRNQSEPLVNPDRPLFVPSPDNSDRVRLLAAAVLANGGRGRGARRSA